MEQLEGEQRLFCELLVCSGWMPSAERVFLPAGTLSLEITDYCGLKMEPEGRACPHH